MSPVRNIQIDEQCNSIQKVEYQSDEKFLLKLKIQGKLERCSSVEKSAICADKIEEERPRWQRFIGKTLIFITILSWLFIGSLIMILQLLLSFSCLLCSHPRWREIYRMLSAKLLYFMYIPPLCVLHYWNRIELKLTLANKQLKKIRYDPMIGILLSNHSSELDHLFLFALADQIGDMVSFKAMAKEAIKYIPLFGWILVFSDVVFVKRKWQDDEISLSRQLDKLLNYPKCLLCLFAEGTRWTRAKHQNSVRWAMDRNLEPFKYHLYPRRRGFNFTVRHFLRESNSSQKALRLFNIEFLSSRRTTFGDFMNGRKIKLDIYIEEFKLDQDVIEEIESSKDESECPKLDQVLIDVFRRKDALVDEYFHNNFELPLEGDRELFPCDKRQLFSLLVWLTSLALVWFLLTRIAITLAPLQLCSSLVCFSGACVLMQRRIAKESQINSS